MRNPTLETIKKPEKPEEVIGLFLDYLHNNYGITKEEFSKIITTRKPQEKEPLELPVTIFTIPDLSPLESITKTLKEHFSLSYHEIAVKLGRDDRTIWAAYQGATKKRPTKTLLTTSKYNIALELLGKRNLSVLEHVVTRLKEHYNLTYHEIAKILERDDRTIWTVYNRVKQKNKRANEKK